MRVRVLVAVILGLLLGEPAAAQILPILDKHASVAAAVR